MKKVEGVIMDWAGTAIDFGCFAPVDAFAKAFGDIQIPISVEEIRIPMGLSKKEHIRQLLQMPRIGGLFAEKQQRMWNEEDVLSLNQAFEKHLFSQLSCYTTPIPGVIEIMNQLRADDIKIGSTTGYTAAMMEIVRPEALLKGYHVDSCVTPDLYPAGRPAPFMIFQNMINLNVQYLDRVVKVGDTIEDIKEGVRAGVWTVGIIVGGNILGLTEEEMKRIPENDLKERINTIKKDMLQAGADYVINTIAELPEIIHSINTKL
ncbi:phosphonoacetaldehyde hydrolase [Chitinophaga sp. 30R24]|uniref:phosphonoacetaldehyde hydrolase n=1 Tax=Chitinophaga sp. 30R24 TaxID=3248838 RepID=UPI003B90617B